MSRIRVLLVDDSAVVRGLFDRALKADAAIEVVGSAGNGEMAIILLKKIEADVILLDEPASALDPIATAAIEDLIHALKSEYTIVIVTHNMQQAMRVADKTAFFSLDESRTGTLIEFAPTDQLFSRPADKRTEAYITGQFG